MQKISSVELNRRDFLSLSAISLCGGLLAGCSGLKLSGTPESPEKYYINHREEIIKDVNKTLVFVEKVNVETYGETDAKAMSAETLERFDGLLTALPYIGGETNELTTNLYQSAMALAFYRSMQNRARTVEETGRVFYLALQQQSASNPMLKMAGRLSSSGMALDKFRSEAKVSQKRTYPADWVFEFVEGDGQSFDYGIDYLECGICKYYRAQGADELVPYMCLLDFPISNVMGSGLVRTSTLGHGGKRCDFRYKNGRPCQMEWTPDFLKNE